MAHADNVIEVIQYVKLGPTALRAARLDTPLFCGFGLIFRPLTILPSGKTVALSLVSIVEPRLQLEQSAI